MDQCGLVARQSVVQNLGEHGVAEPGQVDRAGPEDAVLLGFTHAAGQRGGIDSMLRGDRGQEGQRGWAPTDREYPDQLTRRPGQAVPRSEKCITECFRNRGRKNGLCPGQLPGEQLGQIGVAIRSRLHLSHQVDVHRPPEQVRQLYSGRIRAEPVEVDLVEGRRTSHVRQPTVEWMTIAEILVAARGQQRQPLAVEAGDQIREDVQRRHVRPVQVVDDHDHGMALRDAVEDQVDQRDQPNRRRHPGGTQCRQQCAQLVSTGQNLRPFRLVRIGEPVLQKTDDRRVRERCATEVHARTPQDQQSRTVADVSNQSGLADSSLAADNHRARLPRTRRPAPPGRADPPRHPARRADHQAAPPRPSSRQSPPAQSPPPSRRDRSPI